MKNCCIRLVIYLNCTMMHGLSNLKPVTYLPNFVTDLMKHCLYWSNCPFRRWQINEYIAYGEAPSKTQEPELFDFAFWKQKQWKQLIEMTAMTMSHNANGTPHSQEQLSHATLPITRPKWIDFLITLVHDNADRDSLQICQILPYKAAKWLDYTFCSNEHIYCHHSPIRWTVSSSCIWIREESCLLQSDSSIWPTCCSYHRVTHLASPCVHDMCNVHILLYLLQFLPQILSYSICKLKTVQEIGDAILKFFFTQEIFQHAYHWGSLQHKHKALCSKTVPIQSLPGTFDQ